MKRKTQKINLLKNIKRLWKYIKTSRFNLIGYLLVSITEGIISAILPLISAKIILNLTNGLMNQLVLSALAVFIIDMIAYTLGYLKGYFYYKIYLKTLVDLQVAIARETLKIEISEIDKSTTGLFIDRLNNDTKEISGVFMEYSYWMSYVISNLGVLVAIFILNKYLFIYAVIVSLIIFAINKKRLRRQYEIEKDLKVLQEKKTSLTSEIIRGIRDIKVLNASNNVLEKTMAKIKDAANEESKNLNVHRSYFTLENYFRGISDFALILFGIFLYNNSLITIPTFVIIYNYQSKVKNLLIGVVNLLEYNKKFALAANRIFEVIDNHKFKKETFGNTEVNKLEGNIKFKNIVFGYDKNKKVLNKLNFEIKPNETVAFVGKSGVGKSTIFSLITKLYHADSGNIYLDKHNINDLTCDSIRNNMSIITQNPYIFNFSIKENLQLAKENATMKEIREACKMACIDDYIMSLPKKYNTILGENGVILSGGQKQRIAIARALLTKTEIILFDEATSALDNETQNEIQQAIRNMKGEYTILIIAHRLSTVVDSDKIFVVDEGKVVDSGTHKELLKKCEFYRHLYEKDLKTSK